MTGQELLDNLLQLDEEQLKKPIHLGWNSGDYWKSKICCEVEFFTEDKEVELSEYHRNYNNTEKVYKLNLGEEYYDGEHDEERAEGRIIEVILIE